MAFVAVVNMLQYFFLNSVDLTLSIEQYWQFRLLIVTVVTKMVSISFLSVYCM